MTQENADDVTEQEISDVIDQLQNIADSAPSQLHQVGIKREPKETNQLLISIDYRKRASRINISVSTYIMVISVLPHRSNSTTNSFNYK